MSPHVEPLRALAAAGVCLSEAARRLTLPKSTVHRLVQRHGIVFAACPTMREQAARAGRASAASPRHHRFTDEDRQRSARTRRARALGVPVEPVVVMRRRAFEAAWERVFGGGRP